VPVLPTLALRFRSSAEEYPVTPDAFVAAFVAEGAESDTPGYWDDGYACMWCGVQPWEVVDETDFHSLDCLWRAACAIVWCGG